MTGVTQDKEVFETEADLGYWQNRLDRTKKDLDEWTLYESNPRAYQFQNEEGTAIVEFNGEEETLEVEGDEAAVEEVFDHLEKTEGYFQG